MEHLYGAGGHCIYTCIRASFSEHSKFVTLVNEEVPEDGEEGYSEEGTHLVGSFMLLYKSSVYKKVTLPPHNL